MKHEFKHTREKSGEITIHSKILDLPLVYEGDEDARVFLSSAAGSSSSLCAIYSLDEDELHEFHENKSALDEFFAELKLPIESNLDSLLAARVRILENEAAAQDYYSNIIVEIESDLTKVAENNNSKNALSEEIEALLAKCNLGPVEKKHVELKPNALEKHKQKAETPKKSIRYRKSPEQKAIELANSRTESVKKLKGFIKKIQSGEASPEITIIHNDEIFHISDRVDVMQIRAEKIKQLELALMKFKQFT